MAANTTTSSGLWSNAGIWSLGTVPVNGESVTINHDVEFDVDQSGFASGLSGLAINANLTAATTAGSYYLKMAGDITVGSGGKLLAGTSSTPYPLDCTFEIKLNGAYKITAGTSNVMLYCIQSTNKTIKLSANEGSGQTLLSVNTDVSADWLVGDTIAICNIAGGRDVETTSISSMTSTTITVADALTANKVVGSLIVLTQRNIRITGTGVSGNYGISGGTDNVLMCAVAGCYTGSYNTKYARHDIIVGGERGCYYAYSADIDLIVNANYGIRSGGSNVVGTIAGASSGVYGSAGNAVGTIAGSTYAALDTSALRVDAVIGCNYGITEGSGYIVTRKMENNNIDFSGPRDFVGYGVTTDAPVEYSGYNSSYRATWQYSEIFDYQGLADNYKAWCKGGIVTSDDLYNAPCHNFSYKHSCESDDYPCYRQFNITIPAGKTLNVKALLILESAMTIAPKLEIIDKGADPLWGNGDSPLATVSANGSTALVWQTVRCDYKNTDDMDVEVLVRVTAQGASAVIREITEIIQPAWGARLGGAARLSL